LAVIKDKMTPEGKNFFAEIMKLAKLQVQVGFTADGSGQGAQHEPVTANDYDDGVTVAEIAAWNEKGTYNIPARPFLAQSYDKNENIIEAMCVEQVKAIARGEKDADKAIRAIAAMQVGLIQHEIVNGGFVPNAPITIKGGWMRNKKSGKAFKVKGKKSSTPLIDTGQMRQSVHYVIKPREG